MRAQQQRNVKLRFSLVNLKRDLHDRIKAVDVLRTMIARGIEAQAIKTSAKSVLAGEQLRAAAIGIRASGAQGYPIARGFSFFQANGDIPCWLPLGDIQYMSGDAFHELSHFLKRR